MVPAKQPGEAMFSGSYDPSDVTFLLKPVRLEPLAVAEKERLIQSGRRHYSELISRESLPSPAYLRVFHEAVQRNQRRLARDLAVLARHLAAIRSGPITLVSLARAGTPIGVVLRRGLRRYLGRQTHHYSISIIRDRGIDGNALRHILRRHRAASVVFVDGWTGKGIIAAELRRAVGQFNQEHGVDLDPGLYTVADLCGAAAYAATHDDYLIPSSVLGATISGLVSRSILNDTVIGPDDYHGCLVYEEFAPHDWSRWFVDTIEGQWTDADFRADGQPPPPGEAALRRDLNRKFLADLAGRYGITNANFIKPGVGEATRVLLRRVPDRVLVRDLHLPDVAHLLVLAREKDV
ncbi:MAG: cysteine protease StiP family protein, partial [Gemmataceae bacterium]|nr:cysteine protease StiP family protein [Gemmataceae bacterium]